MCAAWDSVPGTPWMGQSCNASVAGTDFGGSDSWCHAPWCYVDESCPLPQRRTLPAKQLRLGFKEDAKTKFPRSPNFRANPPLRLGGCLIDGVCPVLWSIRQFSAKWQSPNRRERLQFSEFLFLGYVIYIF